MNNSIHRIWLDINETNSQATISCRQGDLARSIYCTLTENGKPYVINTDCYAIFSAKKADETVLFNDCVIQENVIKYDFTPQTTSALGMMNCEIQLFNSEGRLITSPAFNLFVYNKAVEDESILSKDEANTLTNLLADGKRFIEEVKTKLENGEFIGEPGQKGDAFTYDDFTEEQLAQLKGEKGEPGSFTAGDGILVNGDVISTDKSKINYLLPFLEYSKIGGIGYENTAGITSCDTNVTGNVIIPSMINGWIVTEIKGFGSCKFSSVVIPDTVTRINEDCFSECPNLTKVTIPKSVTSIGDYAFDACKSLTDVYYGGSKADFNAINIGSNNAELITANIHYEQQSVDLSNYQKKLIAGEGTKIETMMGGQEIIFVDKNVIATKEDLKGKIGKTEFNSLHLTDRIVPIGLPVKDTVAKTLTFQNFYLNGIYYRVQNPVVNYSEMGNKISVVVECEDLPEQIGNATLSFDEDYSNDEILDLVENGSTSVYGYYRYIPAGSGYAEDMFSYYFSANPIFTYGLGDFETRLKEKIDGEYAKLTDLELRDLPRNIRIASFDGASVVVVFDLKDRTISVSFTINKTANGSGKAYINKINVGNGNYGYMPTFNDETNPMSIHKTFAFDYIVENGVVTYLSTDGVNYLIEKQIESALDEIIEIQEDLLVPNGDEVSY